MQNMRRIRVICYVYYLCPLMVTGMRCIGCMELSVVTRRGHAVEGAFARTGSGPVEKWEKALSVS